MFQKKKKKGAERREKKGKQGERDEVKEVRTTKCAREKKSEMTHFTAQTQKLNITAVRFGSSCSSGMKLRSKADGGENGLQK